MELLNPGHIDPGWGTNSSGVAVGFELTAVIRNISNRHLKLMPNEPFLTLVLDKLQTATTKPYTASESLQDPLKRAADLDMKAERIREFVELQRDIQDQLKDKMSYKDVVESLALLTTSLGLIIAFVVAFVSTTSTPMQLSVNGFTFDRSILLFAFAFLLTVIIIALSVSKRKKLAWDKSDQ
jgi:hypothetical protein